MNEDQEIRAKAAELLILVKGMDEISHAISKNDFKYVLFEGTALDELAEYIRSGKKPGAKAEGGERREAELKKRMEQE